MRPPKDPKDPKSGGGQAPPRPGGRARERLDQFNRQRGIPDDPRLPEDDAKKPRPDKPDEP